MPDKPMTVAAYAAGASLAAITLVYVFGPTFFLDDDSSKSSRKKGVVGLSNPANLCFVNSVLQVLAGLGDLRIYLIRELHRRQLNDWSDETHVRDRNGNLVALTAKQAGLRKGILTQALKAMLDQLNERPIYRKTVSAKEFILQLEYAFKTRLSAQQQDAQEFFQIVAERLCDEYHERVKADRDSRKHHGQASALPVAAADESEKQPLDNIDQTTVLISHEKDDGTIDSPDPDTNAFPLEGATESEIECLTCHFKPKPNKTNFVNLTLSVPQKSSTSLDTCIDGMFKSEKIADFKCDRCRLQHALEYKRHQLEHGKLSTEERKLLESETAKVEQALANDPEKVPDDANLPDVKLAPKRRIEKSMRISMFPKILAIHLSRSIFDPGSVSVKNLAKVSFPELLSIGGLLDRRKYKLLGVVAHQGGHNSGHYETFRRQIVYPAYSTPHNMKRDDSSSKAGSASNSQVAVSASSPKPSTPTDVNSLKSQLPDSPSTPSSSQSPSPPGSQESPKRASVPSRGGASARPSTGMSGLSSAKTISADSLARFRKKDMKINDRWWRISDDKIRECRTSEVLAMQKEVYLLFYELVEEADTP